MNFLLDVAYFLYLIVYLPVLVIKGKWHAGFLSRFGLWDGRQTERVGGENNVWIHAVSVGEVRVIEGVIARIRQDFPRCRVVLSTVTSTGYNLAKQIFSGQENIEVIFAPVDFSGVAAKYMRWINPRLYIAAETEIWPNLYMAAKKRNIPILMINGRISDRSYKKYKLADWLLQKTLPLVDLFCMQSALDRDRIISLGARPDAVKVIGNIKFDKEFHPGSFSREALHIEKGARVWIAASTHPGEEAIVLDVYKSLYEDYHDLRLIIAPRHAERAEEVCSLAESRGFGASRLSAKAGEKGRGTEVIVVDTIGDLPSLFNVSDIVFMGKSLVPGGGQNMIEPALLAKPVIVGPHTENFKDVMRAFLKDQAILEVKDAKQLRDRIEMLLNNPEKCREIGEAALGVCRQNRGATDETFAELKRYLKAVFP